jgi:hypothetical protein
MGDDGPLTPAHLLARTLDEVSKINQQVGEIKTQMAVHLAGHQVWSKIHRAAYAAFVAVIGGLTGLLASHWR